METIIKNKKPIVSLAVIGACFSLSLLFPTKNPIEGLSRSLFFLVFAPIFYIKFVLQEKISDFGWNMKNKKTGFLGVIAFLPLALLISYAIITHTEFLTQYELPSFVYNSFFLFLVYELIFVNILILAYESFFRGFVIFSFPQLKFWSVLVPIAIYSVSLLIFKNPLWVSINDISIAFLAGVLAYKSQSFVYSYLMVVIHAILIDSYIIHLIQ